MYRKQKASETTAQVNESTEGETIEQKIDRIVNNNEPIKDGSPAIFTERDEGVLAGYDIRSDRFEIALDAIDKIQKSKAARRQMKVVTKKEESEKQDNPTGGGDIQGTTGNPE